MSLTRFVETFIGLDVRIELKSGSFIQGIVTAVDAAMNVHLKAANVFFRNHKNQQYDTLTVRGNNIAFIVPPEVFNPQIAYGSYKNTDQKKKKDEKDKNKPKDVTQGGVSARESDNFGKVGGTSGTKSRGRFVERDTQAPGPSSGLHHSVLSGIPYHESGIPLQGFSTVSQGKDMFPQGRGILPQRSDTPHLGRGIPSQEIRGTPPQGSGVFHQSRDISPQGSGTPHLGRGSPSQGSANSQQGRGISPQRRGIRPQRRGRRGR